MTTNDMTLTATASAPSNQRLSSAHASRLEPTYRRNEECHRSDHDRSPDPRSELGGQPARRPDEVDADAYEKSHEIDQRRAHETEIRDIRFVRGRVRLLGSHRHPPFRDHTRQCGGTAMNNALHPVRLEEHVFPRGR
jgi:hypothetical protein